MINSNMNINPVTTQNKQLAVCYRIIREAARKKRLGEIKQTAVRGKFGDQTQMAEDGAVTNNPSAGQV